MELDFALTGQPTAPEPVEGSSDPDLDRILRAHEPAQLQAAREKYRQPESQGEFLKRTMVPFYSAGKGYVDRTSYDEANARVAQGQPKEEDWDTIAQHEARQQGGDFMGNLGTALAHVPAMVGEGMGARYLIEGGQAVGALSKAGGLIPAAARTGIQTAAMPSMYAEDWAARGGKLKDLPAAYTLGYLNTAILGSAQSMAGKGLSGHMKAIGLGMGEQQVADALAGVVGLKTDYGLVGDILQGKTDKALQEGITQAVTFGAFRAIHHGPSHEPIEAAKDLLADLKAKGLSDSEAGLALKTVAEPFQAAAAQGPVSQTQAKALTEAFQGKEKAYADAIASSFPKDRLRRGVPDEGKIITRSDPTIEAQPQSIPETRQEAPQSQVAPESPEASRTIPGASGTPEPRYVRAVTSEQSGEQKPFEHLPAQDIEGLAKQLTGKKLKTAEGLVKALRESGLGEAGIAQLSEATRAPIPSSHPDAVNLEREIDRQVGRGETLNRAKTPDPNAPTPPDQLPGDKTRPGGQLPMVVNRARGTRPGTLEGPMRLPDEQRVASAERDARLAATRLARLEAPDVRKEVGPKVIDALRTVADALEQKKPLSAETIERIDKIAKEAGGPKEYRDVLARALAEVPKAQTIEYVEPNGKVHEFPRGVYDEAPQRERVPAGGEAGPDPTRGDVPSPDHGPDPANSPAPQAPAPEVPRVAEAKPGPRSLLRAANGAFEGTGASPRGPEPQAQTPTLAGKGPASLIDRMRAKQRLDISPHEDPLTKAETAAEKHFAETKYEDIPEDLRAQIEKLNAPHLKEVARSAFAAGGEEGLKHLLILHNTKALDAPAPPKGRRLSSIARQWHEEANKAGIDPEDLHAVAQDRFKLDKEMTAQHNELLSEARDRLKEFGGEAKFLALKRYEQAGQIKGFDEVGNDLAETYPDRFDHSKSAPAYGDQLFGMLKEGKRKASEEESYRQAWDEVHGAAVKLTQKEIADAVTQAKEAGKRSGLGDGWMEEVLAERIRQANEDAQAPEVQQGASAGEDPTDFNFGANVRAPGGEPGAKPSGIAQVPPPRPEARDLIAEAAKELARDEAGTLYVENAIGVPVGIAGRLFNEAKERLGRFQEYLGNSAAKLSGNMFPATTKADRETGEAMARFVATKEYVRPAVRDFIDKVMGPEATQEDMRRVGAVLVEARLRYMRQAYEKARDAELDQVQKTGKPSAKLTEYADGARNVKSIIGADNSPFKTDAEFQQALQDPKVREAIARYQKEFVPVMDELFRKAVGLEEGEEISNFTQMPNLPVNLKRVQPGDPATAPVFTGGKGNLKNLRLRNSPFAKQATGSGAGYEIDMGAIIEHSLTNSAEVAAKHELVRTMIGKDLASWEKPSADKGFREVPFVRSGDGRSLFVDGKVYDDLRQALAVDKPLDIAPVQAFNKLMTKGALASTVELAYHTKNLLTAMTKPGVNPIDLAKNAVNILRGDPETKARLLEQTRIGAARGEVQDAGVYSKYNPLQWGADFLHFADKASRLMMEDAFNRNAEWGRVENTETNKRDFINQLGQYNARAQNKVVAFLRHTGLGPFATAGSNYYMQGLRAMTMNPGVTATSPTQAAGLRAEMFLRTASLYGAAALINYLAWKRVDGDDVTPLGAIKIGTHDGKTQYLDVTNVFSGLPRGLRQTGLNAVIEGKRQGQKWSDIASRAVDQAVHAVAHPAMGPGVQFATTAISGKNTFGIPLSKSKDPLDHLTDALWNFNPILSALSGADRPLKQGETHWGNLKQSFHGGHGDRWMKLAGPFGVQEKKPLKR